MVNNAILKGLESEISKVPEDRKLDFILTPKREREDRKLDFILTPKREREESFVTLSTLAS